MEFIKERFIFREINNIETVIGE